MFHHVALNVRNLEASQKFYEKALAPMGYAVTMTFEGWVGFGKDGKAQMWLTRRDPVGGSVHLAIDCDRRAHVDQFHAAALEAGGKDHGKPGVRQDYSPDYYAAFVLDPDGNNIEAVCLKA
jgi:catechol 2,3-dioxygenase-like lactoylglutathione lyase family enzyme